MIVGMGNPFISAYLQSDWFGKSVFCGLILLSIVSWSVLIHKSWLFFRVRRLSVKFVGFFSDKDPLGLQFNRPFIGGRFEVPHPFFEVYKIFKQHALKVLSKNHNYIPSQETFLSEADLGLIESQVQSGMASQVKYLEKNLFILSTVVTLAPFLGLLGTVWGILLTFSQLHHKGFAMTNNAAMLSGLSLALATTVIGLVVAIPALVGYNYLKNTAREYRRDMEDFSYALLTSLELYYRKPEHAQTATPPL